MKKVSSCLILITLFVLSYSSKSFYLSSKSFENQVQCKIIPCNSNIDYDSVYHFTRDAYYRSPGWGATTDCYQSGAVPVGTDVTLRIRTNKNDFVSVSLIFEGSYPSFQQTYSMSLFETQSGYDYWEVTINSPDEPNECSYYFILSDEDSTVYYLDDQTDYDGGLGTVSETKIGLGFPIIFYSPTFTTPFWHKNITVGYQIFLDRFFNGNLENDAIGNGTDGDILWWEWDLNGNGRLDSEDGERVYATKKEWEDDNPELYDFYGGDLEGIRNKLDYLKELGVDMIYLNPVTDSPDNHGYSVVDYYSIDPYYGVIQNRSNGQVVNNKTASLQIFQDFVSDLKNHGIKLISDIVINHCCAQSPFFQRFENEYLEDKPNQFNVEDEFPDIIGAYENSNSSYYDWFKFYQYNHNYAKFDGQYDTIPTFQYSQTNEIEQELITRNTSIFDFWNNLGVDGFRLDVNQDYEDGEGARYINTIIREKVKSIDVDSPIIGEVWDTAQAPRFLTGTMNDGVQNMHFMDKTRKFIYESLSASKYEDFMLSQQETFPPMALNSFWTLLGNHDTTRIYTYLFGQKSLLKLAVLLQMTYLGVPLIYYGDEVGLHGGSDPDCRRPFPWGNEDQEILQYYQTLATIRKKYSFLRVGGMKMLDDDSSQVLTFCRYQEDNDDFAIILINKNQGTQKVSIDFDDFRLGSKGDVFSNVLDFSKNYSLNFRKKLNLEINGESAMLLIGSLSESSSQIKISCGWIILFTFIGIVSVLQQNKRN